MCVRVCGLDCQSSNKDAGPSETAAAMALKADLVFKRSESMCHQLLSCRLSFICTILF